jgi:hypothetical protein
MAFEVVLEGLFDRGVSAGALREARGGQAEEPDADEEGADHNG